MEDFKTIKEGQLSQAIRDRKPLKLRIPESVLNFKRDVAGVSFVEPIEVAPSFVVYSPEGLAQIIVHGGQDLNGKYVRLVAIVYAFGGTIFYRDIGNDDYEVTVSWPVVPQASPAS